jgi:hypothetical protein
MVHQNFPPGFENQIGLYPVHRTTMIGQSGKDFFLKSAFPGEDFQEVVQNILWPFLIGSCFFFG